MLIDQKQNFQPNEHDLFLAGVSYINSSQWLLAYGIFKQLTEEIKSPTASAFYNLALCYFFTEEYPKTLSVLNKALLSLSITNESAHKITKIPSVLLTHEYESDCYRGALNEVSIDLNNAIVKLRIRRLMVDAHFGMENWQEIIRLAALPEMDKCINVINAVSAAQNKINN